MRYTVDLESPDMSTVMAALRSQHMTASVLHQEARRKHGTGSKQAVELGRAVKALERGLEALMRAASAAVPDRAVQHAEPINQTLDIDTVPTRRTIASRPMSPRR